MEKLLSCAMDIGEQMLVSGAEVHRVEESIERMCYAFGAKRIDVFIITSSMVASIYTADGHCHTQTRRITSSASNFEKIHQLNALSRKICSQSMTAEEIQTELHAITNTKAYPLWLEFIAYAVISGAFAVFFGGGFNEMLTAFCIGAIVRFCLWVSEMAVQNKIFGKFISAAVATALTFLAVKFHLIPTADKVMIGIIMTLIPGIGLTNALRDLFTGDSIAGLLRSVEAVLTALAIAAGYFVAAILGGAV